MPYMSWSWLPLTSGGDYVSAGLRFSLLWTRLGWCAQSISVYCRQAPLGTTVRMIQQRVLDCSLPFYNMLTRREFLSCVLVPLMTNLSHNGLFTCRYLNLIYYPHAVYIYAFGVAAVISMET